jgi:amidohydrolase
VSTIPSDVEPLSALRVRALAALVGALPEAIEVRQSIHRDPRVGGDDGPTISLLRDLLSGSTQLQVLDIADGLLVRSGGAGAAIAIRAEVDALPIQEASGLPWASERPGVAHLCGHDTHTAALVATIRAIESVGAPVPLVAIFQPREEIIPSGAVDILAYPGLNEQDIRAVLGVHVQPVLSQGTTAAAPGAINAAADNFDIIVRGRPAHGAYPHLGRDPILAASAVVQALQQLVSRRVNPINPAVITVGSIAGGTSHNAIPSEVTLQGTIRSYNEDDRQLLHAELRRITEGVAQGYGCEADATVELGEPVLRNDPELAVIVSAALGKSGYESAPALKSCGADDFSFYGERYPSLMIFAGVGDGVPGGPGLHHPGFVPPNETVSDVARIMVVSYFAIAEQMEAAALVTEEKR